MPFFDAADGTKLFYTDEGQGKPVVALSGLTRNSTDFDYLAPHLSDNRLIRLDYRGRGKSAWSGPETYTIPQESQDVLALLNHLKVDKTAIIGTSRGGLIAMTLAALAKERLTGACLVDIGPELSTVGLDVIKNFVGKNPVEKTYEVAIAMRAMLLTGFQSVPQSRWETEVRKHYLETGSGLQINYDPALRTAVLATADQPMPDLWPLFDALADLPLALVRGQNSDLLTPETAQKMRARRPDMIFADVPDRGHVPFLDEPQALEAIHQWLGHLE